MLLRTVKALAVAGVEQVGLAVLRENVEGRADHARLGGREVAEFTDTGPLWKSGNVLLIWDHLAASLAKAQDQ